MSKHTVLLMLFTMYIVCSKEMINDAIFKSATTYNITSDSIIVMCTFASHSRYFTTFTKFLR